MKNLTDIEKKIKWSKFYEIDSFWTWREISKREILSEEFISTFADKLDWYQVSKNQKLSEDFIRTYKDRVAWTEISSYQKLSKGFILEFKDKIIWTFLYLNTKLPRKLRIDLCKKYGKIM